MNGLVLLIIGLAVLLCGYIFYGRWLCKQWGVGENNEATPAHTMEDGVDYVPAKAPILMGHHFSSIAGAGPITGPISAAGLGFGWLACTLWILIGGIFFARRRPRRRGRDGESAHDPLHPHDTAGKAPAPDRAGRGVYGAQRL